MNQAVTYLGLIHVGLFIAFILSLLGVAWFWLSLLATGMSDAPQSGGSGMTSLIVAHALPVVLFVAWWLT